VISLQRVNRHMGTLCRNLRDHFLQCSLHHVLCLGDEAGKSPVLHILLIRIVRFKPSFAAAPFGSPNSQPNRFKVPAKIKGSGKRWGRPLDPAPCTTARGWKVKTRVQHSAVKLLDLRNEPA
jgi:hypothetical protein